MPDAPTLSVELRQERPIPLAVSVSCGPGDVLALFGPSGSGKTTILRCIAGLHRPADGRVVCGGEVWTDTGRGVHLAPHQRAVGVVFQEYALFPHLTAIGNVAAALGHRPRSERAGEAQRLLSLVHLAPVAHRRPAQLSGGQRQRVALARALAREPRVLLLDEPFAAVDHAVRRTLQDELDELRARVGVPIVLVTHDLDDVVRLATHVAVIERGRVVAQGTIDALSSRPDLPWLADAHGPGSVLDATVTGLDAERGLMTLTFDGGTLLAPGHTRQLGARLRVRIPARDVILATERPRGLSLHNVLETRVADIRALDGTDRVLLQLAAGEARLLAEVTRDAVTRLSLAAGSPVFALVKSVSLDVK